MKFRVWDKKQKRMIFGSKSGKVMLSTGLIDKNGKEIYEGDIITDGKLKGDVKFGKHKHYFGNSFSPAIGFYLDGDEKFFFSEILRKNGFSKMKIIGNIYKK